MDSSQYLGINLDVVEWKEELEAEGDKMPQPSFDRSGLPRSPQQGIPDRQHYPVYSFY